MAIFYVISLAVLFLSLEFGLEICNSVKERFLFLAGADTHTIMEWKVHAKVRKIVSLSFLNSYYLYSVNLFGFLFCKNPL